MGRLRTSGRHVPLGLEETTAQVVNAEKRAILARWRVAARALAPDRTASLDDTTLEDHLPALLDAIAAALRGEATSHVEEEGAQHGSQRRRLGFPAALCIQEVHRFRRELLDTLETRMPAGASWGDLRTVRHTVLELIDRSIEASVRQYNVEAEGERDRALAALQEANDALQQSHTQKDRFLAMLAHELRNQLAPILAAVAVLKRGDAPADSMRRARDIIDRQSKHQARLVDDLLDVNRIARGKIEIVRATFDLRDAVRHAVEACRPGIDARKQPLEVRLPDAPVPVVGDATRLAQVLTNLLGNASKFTPPSGGIVLALTVEEATVVVRVRDTGAGIAPEAMPLLFELFAQLEGAAQRPEGGLGVGLWLARTLVEMHGGTIVVTSPGLGRGTEVVVRLPLAAGERS